MSADTINALANDIERLVIHKSPLNMASVISTRMRSGATFSMPRLSALYLMEKPKTTKETSKGKLLDANWIDRDLAGSWKSACDADHVGLCKAFPNRALSSIRPAWLVDVKRQCLVEAPEDCSYIALSYVWGSQSTFNTTESDLIHLQSDGSLSGQLAKPIARTIRDAMGLVEILSEQYLWVDTLCIVQDNQAQKALEIAKMAMIYANASVTLFAADGEHANSGLRGLQGISEPRRMHQTIHCIDKETMVVMTPVPWASRYEPGNDRSIWESRGWIFQEYFFSRRRLIFNGNCIRWECNSAVWREHVQLPPELDSIVARIVPCSFILEGSTPDLSFFTLILSDYNRKQFTYPEDCLHGFAGISLLFSTQLCGGFVSGLPTAFFDLVLLWEPGGHITRRVAKDLTRANELPSWSWAGWFGYVIFPAEPEYDFIKAKDQSQRIRTQGTIRTRFWKSHETSNSTGTPIHARIFDCKDAANSGQLDYDPSWSKHRVSEDSKPVSYHPSRICRTHFYKHEAFPSLEFWYPIPVPQPEQVVSPVVSPYISSTSQRAWLFCDQKPWKALEGYPLLSLRQPDGTWAGALRPHDDLDISGLRLQDPNEPVELVEIAGGYCSETELSIDEKSHPERPKSSHWYEYYTVMWVKWVEGIAYRRGLGRVHRACWEAQRGDPFEFILG
ncbi:unnamed protein product [Fusarium equiseti]|uniref:Heterokaryon incompatibility domain-containing protein n=1 Tax=Fusarium equiseti TaxID=61235 RepID=A0A8J2ISQ3_FUSEQ|nr:unnamed protein product [Fusarium equiseti]